jgi:hypothetical protein
MKLVQLLIGDYEYEQIKEIFEHEADFKPIDEKDQIIIKTLGAVVSPKNIVEENVGGEETESLTVKKVQEPEGKNLEGNVEFKI